MFEVLDAVPGQVAVSANTCRKKVGRACRKGEQGIEEMFDKWLEHTPQESREMLSMLESSCEEEVAVDDTPKKERP